MTGFPFSSGRKTLSHEAKKLLQSARADPVMRIVGLSESLAVVHDQVALLHIGVNHLQVGLRVRNFGEVLPDDLLDLFPLGHPLLLRKTLPLIGAAHERIEVGFLTDQAVQHDAEVHPDIVPLITNGKVHDRRGVIPSAVQVLPESLDFGLKVVPGRLRVRDQMPGSEVVLAEALVDVLHAGLRIILQLLPDGSFRHRRLATEKKE